ncbi:DUF6644 family protein [Allosphingosinicella deserti]|uniref:DUF6644 family protein n=1 Tax=Allosphingosinicella deserti TaxID=2116704 RepID=UPI0018ECFE6A|nr:DUF6644 family protein [Sphingomonas deserti]
MDGALLAIADALNDWGVGGWARSSPSAYPFANVVHLLGLVMLIGSIGVVDLRIAGLWRAIPLGPLARALIPVAAAGLVILAGSGLILFAADGRALAVSDTFQLKLLLIGAGLANVLLFRLLRRGRDPAADPTLAVRLAASLSLLIWLGVGTAGRMIAYA